MTGLPMGIFSSTVSALRIIFLSTRSSRHLPPLNSKWWNSLKSQAFSKWNYPPVVDWLCIFEKWHNFLYFFEVTDMIESILCKSITEYDDKLKFAFSLTLAVNLSIPDNHWLKTLHKLIFVGNVLWGHFLNTENLEQKSWIFFWINQNQLISS